MKRVWLVVCWLLLTPAHGAELVVVMDDLGYSLERARRVVDLPGPVTLGLLPFAPATPDIARLARDTGHEVILHQPMESLPGAHVHPVPGTLTVDMSPERFEADLLAALAAVPGIVGLNNHTGSRLTQDPAAMRRLMHHLAHRDLMFLDSRTTAATVAYAMAREARVPALERDVFLDHVVDVGRMEREFHRALAIARRRGYAVVIAHPHDATLRFLEDAFGRLPDEAVTLGSLRDLVSRSRPATLARAGSPASRHKSLGQ